MNGSSAPSGHAHSSQAVICFNLLGPHSRAQLLTWCEYSAFPQSLPLLPTHTVVSDQESQLCTLFHVYFQSTVFLESQPCNCISVVPTPKFKTWKSKSVCASSVVRHRHSYTTFMNLIQRMQYTSHTACAQAHWQTLRNLKIEVGSVLKEIGNRFTPKYTYPAAVATALSTAFKLSLPFVPIPC